MTIILIVEDEQIVRQLMIAILTPEHQVVEAVDVAQAIESARLTQPDLVLLDLNLQGHYDGLDICRALRNDADPMLAQVPILMLTGQTDEADVRMALAAGATGYVGKPYSPHVLLELVGTLLAKGGV